MYGGVGPDQCVDRSCQANETRQTNGRPAGCNREVHPNICAWCPWREYPTCSGKLGDPFKFGVQEVNKPKGYQNCKEASNMEDKHKTLYER